MLTNRNSWKNALSACQSAVSDPSATLASVPDQTTSDFLITLSPSSSVWVGGFKNSDGQWAWSDGSQMTFTNWGTGKPDNCCGGLQDYVVFYPFSQGKWNDLKESKRKRAVCQYDRPTIKVEETEVCKSQPGSGKTLGQTTKKHKFMKFLSFREGTRSFGSGYIWWWPM